MNNYINKLSCLNIEQSSNHISISKPQSYFHKQTEKTLIRQLLQELSDLGLLFAKVLKWVSIRKGLSDTYALKAFYHRNGPSVI